MLGWARKNTKEKEKKMNRIIDNSKEYKVLSLKEINMLENIKD